MELHPDLITILDLAYTHPKKYSAKTISEIRLLAGNIAKYLVVADNKKENKPGILKSIRQYQSSGKDAAIVAAILAKIDLSDSIFDHAAEIYMIDTDFERNSNDGVSLHFLSIHNEIARNDSYRIKRDGVSLKLEPKGRYYPTICLSSWDNSIKMPDFLDILRQNEINEHFDFTLKSDRFLVKGHIEEYNAIPDEDYINSKYAEEKSNNVELLTNEISDAWNLLYKYVSFGDNDKTIIECIDAAKEKLSADFDSWFNSNYRSLEGHIEDITYTSSDGKTALKIQFFNPGMENQRMDIFLTNSAGYNIFNKLYPSLYFSQ